MWNLWVQCFICEPAIIVLVQHEQAHCSCIQFWFCLHHFACAFLWEGMSGMQKSGFLACSPLSWSLLETVLLETDLTCLTWCSCNSREVPRQLSGCNRPLAHSWKEQIPFLVGRCCPRATLSWSSAYFSTSFEVTPQIGNDAWCYIQFLSNLSLELACLKSTHNSPPHTFV